MRNHLAAVLTIFLSLFLGGRVAAQQTGPLKSAASDSHEGITISVQPWVRASDYKEKFPKKSPFTGGVAGLHVTIRNNSDESVKVDLLRIRLLLILGEENRQELVPLSPDDVADAVLLKGAKDPTQRRNPLPMPVGKPNPTRDKNWTDFKNDCQNASIPSPVVAAHSSVDGLVYFDLRSEWDVLQNAKLYVPNLVSMVTNTPLSYFEIDLGHGAGN
ncbi:MAG TPA: hypothetical protein VGH37_11345 [Candidatus Acidoferrum sp.]|jgi:hypothetical protein